MKFRFAIVRHGPTTVQRYHSILSNYGRVTLVHRNAVSNISDMQRCCATRLFAPTTINVIALPSAEKKNHRLKTPPNMLLSSEESISHKRLPFLLSWKCNKTIQGTYPWSKILQTYTLEESPIILVRAVWNATDGVVVPCPLTSRGVDPVLYWTSSTNVS